MHTSMGKKLLAGLLSVVMVLSLFATVPTAANKAEAASSWSLTGKTSVESLTTNNYVLKGLKTTQYAKVSVTGTAKAGVTVKKGSTTVKSTTKIVGTGKNITFKLKNANVPGKKYTFTVKVYGKKSGKLLKTLKKTATVYKKTTEVAVAPSTATLKIGETVQLTTVVKPSTSTEKLTFASSNTEVATVDANGLVTAVAEGTTVVTVKSGSKYAFVSVAVSNVVDNAKVAKLETSLEGVIKGMDHTYLANQDAKINVKAVDANGTPVANAQIFFFARTNYKHPDGTWGPGTKSLFDDEKKGYQVLGNGIATTDANGNAVFVVASGKGKDNNGFDNHYVGEIAFDMITAGTDAAKTAGIADFAAITFGDVVYSSTTTPVSSLVPGTNATEVGYVNGLAATYSVNKVVLDTMYLHSQQVSKAGTANHAVMVSTDPGLDMPNGGVAGDEQTAEFVQEVNFKSDSYTVYSNALNGKEIEKFIDLEIENKKIDYATVHINNIQLSKYTELWITPYKYNTLGKRVAVGATEKIVGEKEQAAFGYQIPVTAGTEGVAIQLVSEGQVNTAKNSGFEVSKITGMYKKDTLGVSNKESYDAIKVEWKLNDSVLYDNDKDLKATYMEVTGKNSATADTDLAVLVPKYNKDHKYSYKVPSFPQTGNAIVTEYDQNNKVVAYFAFPTINDVVGGVTQNKNVLNLGDKANVATAAKAYMITADEATKITGKILKQAVVKDLAGNNHYAAIVDAETVGVSPLMATVSVADANDNNKTVEGGKLYTSIHWNPIPGTPEAGEVEKDSDAFIALKGQFIEVEAQITDQNGNKVSQSGVNVEFKYGDTVINENDTITNKPHGNVKVVAATKQTDANGLAKIKFQAGEVATLANVKAEVAGKKYGVVLKIAGQTTTKADLYWIDANIGFTDMVDGTDYSTAGGLETIPAEKAKPYAGETWDYGFYVLGSTALAGGILDGSTAKINGLDLNFKTSGMTDAVETKQIAGSVVRMTAKKAGTTNLKARIDNSTFNEKVTVSVTKAAVAKTAFFAGTGATSIDKSLTLPITWMPQGITGKFVNPNNGKVATGADTFVYFQALDSLGYPVNGQKVNWSYATATGTATTNSDGIAIDDLSGDPIEVKAAVAAGAPSVVVSCVLDGVNEQTYSTIINYKTAADKLAMVGAKYVAGTEDKIELTFNKELDEKSVIAKQFTVGDGTNYFGVKSATVNDNKVILTLTGGNVFQSKKTIVTVKYADAIKDSVEYVIRTEEGNETFRATADTIDFTANADDVAEVSSTGLAVNVALSDYVAWQSGGNFNVYLVDANGAVVDAKSAAATVNLTAPQAGTYTVYFGNYVKQLTDVH